MSTGVNQNVAEHARLLASMDAVRSERELPRLAERLDELAIGLALHFDEEERPGGVIDSVSASRPNQAPQLEQLVGEHVQLRFDLVALLDRVQACLAEEARVREDVGRFLDQIRAHEARESELLTALIYTELGAGE